MSVFIEILKIILPACITGLITFLVTRYTYKRNVPLDKFEISYNRVYYPIYRLLNSDGETLQVIEKSRSYLVKYYKYVDKSTLVAFYYLENNSELKKAYDNFRDNIFYISNELRRRLGYLEPSILKMYTYSAPKEKRLFRLIFELLGSYLPLLTLTIIELSEIRNFMIAIWFISVVALLLEGLAVVIISVKERFGKKQRK